MLVCARDFNPTEPRDGIFLTCQSRSKIDDEIQQNRDIIERACELYKKLLEYVAEKGDVLLGKTFTTDPISKRRLANMGEQDQFYIRDHHESIVSREVWDEAERIRMKRSKNKIMETSGNRERYTRQYAFSSMCECSYCGHKLTRRTRHSSSIYEKPVWQCMNATKNGIKNCPHCKAIDEAILEGAFLEAFGLLAGNFDDVLDIVMSNVEEALNNAEDVRKKQQLDKDISSLESKNPE